MAKGRNFGILLPVSSLPSGEGIGTLGTEAYNFVDFLSESGGKIWQVLPLNPTNYGDSPDQSCSSDALNYYFIDLQQLVCDGLLKKGEIVLEELSDSPLKVNYGKQFTQKIALLKKAFSRFDGGSEFEDFVNRGEYSDFAVFMAIKQKFNHVAWTEWEQPFGVYDEDTVAKFVKENKTEYLFWQFTQFIFLKQWNALKSYANSKGVSIMGDIPLYVAYDSVEVWKYGEKLFKVNANRKLKCVAGCPPDGFTEDGQLWGNPVYNWEEMRNDGYAWWKARIEKCFKLFDVLRIDHFRGLDRYYAIPAGNETAEIGEWLPGPGIRLFNEIKRRIGDVDIIAEDLGFLDNGVVKLRMRTGFPGMCILQFAFDGSDTNSYLPQNMTENSVAYTGTHDNDTTLGFINAMSEEEFKSFKKYLRAALETENVVYPIATREEAAMGVNMCALASKARLAIIPVQDLLTLDTRARMNIPSTSEGNWRFRLEKIPDRFHAAIMRKAVDEFGR